MMMLNHNYFQYPMRPSNVITGFFSMCTGGWAYLHFHILGINVNHFWHDALQLLWTVFVGAMSAGAGVIVKKLIEDHWLGIKSFFKLKRK